MQRRSAPNANLTVRQLGITPLEDRRMLAIVWANEFDTGALDPEFDTYYGANEVYARAAVNRAIADWNQVVIDQNRDGDNNPVTNPTTFSLTVMAMELGTERGMTEVTKVYGANEIPTEATILLDDDGGETGWFFDTTPYDDAEFTAIANSNKNLQGTAFQASFIDANTPNQNYSDLYRTIMHEIGHALGIYLVDTGTNSQLDRLYNLSTNTADDPQSSDPVDRIRVYSGASGTVALTTQGGGHFYEGHSSDSSSLTSHPNELMNPGRALAPTGADPIPTTRQFISDTAANLLKDVYGYLVVLPSSLGTAHASLDAQTGTLLIQGRLGWLLDTVQIDIVGASTRVRVNSTTELFATADVNQIVFDAHGGGDTPSITGITVPVHTVYWIVSSNQDAVDPGTLGDVYVDLDPDVAGMQVSLRGALQDANSGAGGSIYIPRGRYRMTIEGTGGIAAGDFDISQSTTLIGTGAGETVIDASSLGSLNSSLYDRVFEVNGSGKTLTLNSLTVTGGKAPISSGTPSLSHGGGVFVRDYSYLVTNAVAITDNETTNTSASLGGGVYFSALAGGTLANSVVTNNYSAYRTGGVYLGGTSAASAINSTATIYGLNTAAAAMSPQAGFDIASDSSSVKVFTSGGNNRVGANNSTLGLSGTGDYFGAVNYIVSGVGDTFNHADDSSVRSLRDAIDTANSTSGAQEIWLPSWDFLLTRERDRTPGSTDTSISRGDLDISGSLTIRGVSGATQVAWRSTAAYDRVFELLGDYSGNGAVDDDDYEEWISQYGQSGDFEQFSADGNDDGVVSTADYSVWLNNYSSVFTRIGV